VKNFYNENLKTLKKKDIEEDTRRWKYYQCSWISRINSLKMTTPLKEIYRFIAHSSQNRKMIPKSYMNA
jgi:hypothetical protein